MLAWNEEHLADDKRYVHLMRTTFTDHAPARNNLAANFIGDWLLQLDADHCYEPDLCSRLLHLANEVDVDVVSGFYQLKSGQYLPVLFQWVGEGEKLGLQPLATWPKEARLLEIGSAGAGCLFVRRKVFDRIVTELNEQPFDKIHPYSEDHSFFLRCRRLGIKCYAAMNVHCHHLSVRPITLEDHQPCGATAEQFVGGFA